MSTPPTLDYSSTKPRSFWRRYWRIIVLSLLLTYLTLMLLDSARPMMQKGTILYWQNRCMNFTAPPDVRGLTPDCWKQYASMQLSMRLAMRGEPASVVFLHEMISPGGHHRLVAIPSWGNSGRKLPDNLIVHVIQPGTPFAPAHVLYSISRQAYMGPGDEGDSVVTYFGQLDPHDPGHVMLRVRSDPSVYSNRLNAIIDGYLNDDDTVTFKVRRFPATLPLMGF